MDGQSTTGHPQHSVARHKAPQNKAKKTRLIVAIVVVAIGAILTVALLATLRGTSPDGNGYQAVFLNNGQVFFGKLKNTNGTYLKLEKAYYTQKQDLPSDATAEQKAATANNVSLIKVGDEVYGPEGNMNIRADQVLFWQNLKSDSKVAKAIDSKS